MSELEWRNYEQYQCHYRNIHLAPIQYSEQWPESLLETYREELGWYRADSVHGDEIEVVAFGVGALGEPWFICHGTRKGVEAELDKQIESRQKAGHSV